MNGALSYDRLRDLPSDRAVMRGRQLGPAGYASASDLAAYSAACAAAFDALPDLLTRIADLEGENGRLREAVSGFLRLDPEWMDGQQWDDACAVARGVENGHG